METINSFVFFDLETTGLPSAENNRTKITELSMVAVSRNSIQNYNRKGIPRVIDKLSLCLNPMKRVSFQASFTTGLWNTELEDESTFNIETTELINLFLRRLQPPVCLVAHNGYNFDYPIFNSHIFESKGKLSDDVLCVDSILLFKDVLKNDRYSTKNTRNVEGSILCTPIKTKLSETSIITATPITPEKRELEKSLSAESSPNASCSTSTTPCSPRNYQLSTIYQYLIGRPAENTHRAECDCMILLECCTTMGADFLRWCDNKSMHLNRVERMEVGKEFPRVKFPLKRRLFE